MLSQDLEAECAKSGPSDLLEEIGFQLLKFVSSRRDITFVLALPCCPYYTDDLQTRQLG